MDTSSEICLNVTSPPVALVPLSLPPDSSILFYHEKTGNRSLFLDFAARSHDVPFALRAHSTGSAFTIRSPTGGFARFSVLPLGSCSGGVVVLTSSRGSYLFTNSAAGAWALSREQWKCIVIENTANMTVSVNTTFAGYDIFSWWFGTPLGPDFHDTENWTLGTTRPLVIHMWLKDVLADRRALISIRTTEPLAEAERFIYLGAAQSGVPTHGPLSPTDPGADFSVSLEFLVGLVACAALFAATLAVAVVRHRMCRKRPPGTPGDDDGRGSRKKYTAPSEGMQIVS
jgi:hypothetical protein